MMDRRQFLKALGITIVATQVPVAAIAETFKYRNFNPNDQYGDYCEVTDFISPSIKREAMALLDDGIKETIPPSYRHKIKWLVINPKPTAYDPLAQRGTVGWKYDKRH